MSASAGLTLAFPGIIDLLGEGVGQAPVSIIGNQALFGEDSGIGRYRPFIDIVIGTAFVTATSATLNIAFQGAPDLGTPTYLPGTWQTFSETGGMTAAQLTANQIIRMDWSAAFPPNENPRYLRLFASVLPAASGIFTAGIVSYALVVPTRDDQSNKYAQKNYSVS